MPNCALQPTRCSARLIATFAVGLPPCRPRRPFHCAWTRTCWHGSKRKAPVIRPESTPCYGRFVMHRFDTSVHLAAL